MCCRGILLLLLTACGVAESWWWWGWYQPWNQYDYTGRDTKLVALNITHELVADAYLRINGAISSSQGSRAQVHDAISANTGQDLEDDTPDLMMIVGQIREKYRRMMEHYYQWRDKASGKSVFVGPGIRGLVGLHWLLSMEHVSMIEHDIRKYIDAVLDHFLSDELPPYVKPKGKGRKGKKIKRMGTEEQDLKRRFRAQYMARRLGMPANYTTRSKRFQNQWPVEDTWDNFGPYDVGL